MIVQLPLSVDATVSVLGEVVLLLLFDAEAVPCITSGNRRANLTVNHPLIDVLLTPVELPECTIVLLPM